MPQLSAASKLYASKHCYVSFFPIKPSYWLCIYIVVQEYLKGSSGARFTKLFMTELIHKT